MVVEIDQANSSSIHQKETISIEHTPSKVNQPLPIQTTPLIEESYSIFVLDTREDSQKAKAIEHDLET